MTDVTLFCLLDGDPLKKSFTVRIPSGEYISELKELIKVNCQNRLNGVDACELSLYLVSLADESELQHLNLDSIVELSARTTIDTLFRNSPGENDYFLAVDSGTTNADPPEPSGTAMKKLRWSDRSIQMKTYTRLHNLLWDKETALQDVVFVEKTFLVPEFAEDGSCRSTQLKQSVLSLDGAIIEYLRDNPSENDGDWNDLLPCQSNTLVFREAYRELRDCIVQLEKTNGHTSRDGATVTSRRRHKTNRAFIVTGQPGIGKTWFLSSILVDRLLRGEVTVLQCRANAILFDKTGVSYLRSDSSPAMRNVEVWALADETPRGFVDEHENHEWLVIVTSSPNPQNYKRLRNEHSAPLYYMQVWSWPEIVAASSTGDLNKLHILWDLFNLYGPVARLLLQHFRYRGPEFQRVYNQDIDSELVRFLRTGASFLDEHFAQDDSHTILLLLPKFHEEAEFKHISMSFMRRVASPMIGIRLGLLGSSDITSKGREMYNRMLQDSYFATASGPRWPWALTPTRSGVVPQIQPPPT